MKEFIKEWIPAVGPLITAVATITGIIVAAIIAIYTTQKNIKNNILRDNLQRQEANTRDLLTEILNLMSMKEAWILQGPDGALARLSDMPKLSIEPKSDGLWLMAVEMRAVLDRGEWNAPSQNFFYAFLDGRRAWILRDAITGKQAYNGAATVTFPALISSKGRQELIGWIERVYLARSNDAITDPGMEALRAFLVPLASPDRVDALRILLSPGAEKFLLKIRVEWNGDITAAR
jgi:hypothetical protein